MKLLFAGNYRQAKQYADEHKEEKFYIITDSQQIRGIERGTIIILVGTYLKNPEYKILRRIIRERFEVEYK